ncbi:MAG: hypothetical protein KJO11_05155 [Gemmatimonadetes bacterium]|nr:hypothetical protein [Gemmatimonadota bacterium]
MMTTTKHMARAFGLAAAASLALVSGASGQSDDAWFAYLGCWESLDGAGPALCIRPTLDGVELTRVADGEIVDREPISSGPRAAISEREGCRGEHTAAFSADSRRVFLTSEYACEGGTNRSERGIFALLGPDELLDVRSVDVDGEAVAWVQSYRAASPTIGQEAGVADLPRPGMALETARRSVARSIDVDDVIEAHEAVGAAATEAWVAETGDRFDLDAQTLVALADRGVPAELLDLMIAVSYPERFALAVDDRGPYAEAMAPSAGRLPARGVTRGWAGPGWGNPFFWDPFYFSPFGYRYSRYSYGPYGWAGGWYGNPGTIIVNPGGSASSNNGRVVRGRGYTRGGSRSSPPASTGTSTSVGRSGGSSSGTASSGGGTGSTRTPPVRRAKPRGGGGGLY